MTTVKQQELVELFQSKMMALVTRHMLDKVDETQLPEGFNSNILKQTKDQLERFNREVLRTTPKQGTYLDKHPKDGKLTNLATVIDLFARIGYEESFHTYDDLINMFIDTLDLVFYAQRNRKNLHLGKYRTLLGLVEKELDADLNKKQSSFVYLNNKRQLAFVLGAEPEHEKIDE
jgi:hypothetical protein